MKRLRDDPQVHNAFLARVDRDPAGAVRVAVARGYVVDEADVPTPYTRELERLPKAMQGEFAVSHSPELAGERTALSLARSSREAVAKAEAEAARHRADDRERRIASRAAELEAQDLATRRAQWRAQAEREVDGIQAERPKARAGARA